MKCSTRPFSTFDKTFFYNVDTQKDFIDSAGALAIPEAESIKPVLQRLTQFAATHDIRVVNSADWHQKDSAELSDTPDFIKTFPAHCLINTDGARFIAETQPSLAELAILDWQQNYTVEQIHERLAPYRQVLLLKDKFDVFVGNPHAEKVFSILKNQYGLNHAMVYGVAGNVCVDFAVKGLLARGFWVSVVSDAIKNLPNLPDPVVDWQEHGIQLVTSTKLFSTINTLHTLRTS